MKKIAPHWAHKMDDIVDTVHRLGPKQNGRTRNTIVQFVRRQHRDSFWKMTKASSVCDNAGIRFAEDLTKEVEEAREVLWPPIR